MSGAPAMSRCEGTPCNGTVISAVVRPAEMNKKKVWYEIRVFLAMLLVISSLRSALADWNDVPTGSMKPTIEEGDRVVVNKLAYDLKIPFTTIELAKQNDPKRG